MNFKLPLMALFAVAMSASIATAQTRDTGAAVHENTFIVQHEAAYQACAFERCPS